MICYHVSLLPFLWYISRNCWQGMNVRSLPSNNLVPDIAVVRASRCYWCSVSFFQNLAYHFSSRWMKMWIGVVFSELIKVVLGKVQSFVSRWSLLVLLDHAVCIDMDPGTFLPILTNHALWWDSPFFQLCVGETLFDQKKKTDQKWSFFLDFGRYYWVDGRIAKTLVEHLKFCSNF